MMEEEEMVLGGSGKVAVFWEGARQYVKLRRVCKPQDKARRVDWKGVIFHTL